MSTSRLQEWIDESDESKRLFSRESLIVGVSEAIWESLEQKGWNKRQLAEALGRSPADVTQLLSGSRNMTLRNLADIAFALGMDVDVRFVQRDRDSATTD